MMASFLDALVLTVVGLAVVFLVLIINALVTSLLKSASREKKEIATPLPSQRMLFEQESMIGLPEADAEGETLAEGEALEEVEPEVVAAIVAALHYHMLRMSKVNYGVVRRSDVRRGL